MTTLSGLGGGGDQTTGGCGKATRTSRVEDELEVVERERAVVGSALVWGTRTFGSKIRVERSNGGKALSLKWMKNGRVGRGGLCQKESWVGSRHARDGGEYEVVIESGQQYGFGSGSRAGGGGNNGEGSSMGFKIKSL